MFMPAGLTFLNIILCMYLSKGSFGKENRNNTLKVTINESLWWAVFFKYKHFPCFSEYIINYMQTLTLSNHPTIQMNGCKSHCIKNKNGIHRRLHLFTKCKLCWTTGTYWTDWGLRLILLTEPPSVQLFTRRSVNVPGQKTRKLSTRN